MKQMNLLPVVFQRSCDEQGKMMSTIHGNFEPHDSDRIKPEVFVAVQ